MPDPIIQRRPDAERALVNKTQRNPTLYNNAPNAIQRALMQLDIERAGKGQNPLSVPQTKASLEAIRTGNATTKVPEDEGFLRNLASDALALTSAIPKLPLLMYREVQALPEAPAAIAKAANAGSPLDVISGIAQAPGVRLLPGSFIAANLKTPENLKSHPLFTALDILPAKQIPAVKGGLSKAASVVREAPVTKSLRATRPAQVLKETFGQSSRDLAQMSNEADTILSDQLHDTRPPKFDPVVTDLTRRSMELPKKHNIPNSRVEELTPLMAEDSPLLHSLPANELAYVSEARQIVDQYRDYTTSEGMTSLIDGEVFDNKTAGKILAARKEAEFSRFYADIREGITNPTPELDPTTLLDKAEGILKRTDLKIPERRRLIEGVAYGLEAAGYDTSTLLSAIKQSKNSRIVPADMVDSVISDAIAAQRTSLVNVASPEVTANLLSKLEGLTPKSSAWTDVRAALKAAGRDYADVDAIIAHERRMKSANTFANKFGVDEKVAVRKAKNQARVEARNAPARFQPILRKKQAELMKAQLVDNPDFPTLMQHLADENYSYLRDKGIFTQKEIDAFAREATETWKELKDAGVDPIFVHSVSPGQEFMLQFPKVLESLRKVSQTKERLYDSTPAINNMTIAMGHQGMEILARKGSERFVQQIAETWGRTESDVLSDYISAARQRASRDKSLSLQGHAKRMIDKEWVRFEPENLIDFQPSRLQRFNPRDPIMIPRSLANNLKRTHTPPAGRLTGVIDPVMNVFRTALLPLSVRWHTYNVLSGGLLLTVQAGPRVWRNLGQAYDMVKNKNLPEHMPRGMGSIPRDTLEWQAKSKLQSSAFFHHSAGKTLRRIYDSTQQVRDAAGNVIQKSYDFNGFVDDMYRAMAYLEGHNTSLTKGMTKEAAQSAGIELARKTMQNWDRMTPIERTIMRYVFPFYGWMNHIMRYAYNYPIDHPFRTAVTASFARNELEDRGSGLPERFLNTFFLGDMDENGNVTGLNLAGINPFADVSNYFTLSGFMGQVNPAISTLLESLGLDPQSGGPELFPNLRYDSETGRLSAQSPNILKTFAGNVIPQSRILMGMFDSSSEYQELLRTNPAAANRLLISSAGLPLLFRDVNIPQETAKAEVKRMESQTNAFNDALKTGDWDYAKKFPALKPLFKQIEVLQGTGALDDMAPGEVAGQSVGQIKIGDAQNELIKSLTGK